MTDVTIQLADKRGDLWEVTLPMMASAVSDVILDNPAKGYYADIPEEWRKAFCERLLMRGLQTLDDSDDHTAKPRARKVGHGEGRNASVLYRVS